MCYATTGMEPTRQFVVTWDTATEGDDSDKLSFSIILHENSRNVDVVYGTMTTDSQFPVGQFATIAIRNKPGNTATTFSCNDAVPLTNTAIRFTAVALTRGQHGGLCQAYHPLDVMLCAWVFAGLGFRVQLRGVVSLGYWHIACQDVDTSGCTWPFGSMKHACMGWSCHVCLVGCEDELRDADGRERHALQFHGAHGLMSLCWTGYIIAAAVGSNQPTASGCSSVVASEGIVCY